MKLTSFLNKDKSKKKQKQKEKPMFRDERIKSVRVISNDSSTAPNFMPLFSGEEDRFVMRSFYFSESRFYNTDISPEQLQFNLKNDLGARCRNPYVLCFGYDAETMYDLLGSDKGLGSSIIGAISLKVIQNSEDSKDDSMIENPYFTSNSLGSGL